jgi:predicted lipid-binding transport protein (Tim44 family)
MKKIFWPMPVVTVFAAALAIAQDAPPKPAAPPEARHGMMGGMGGMTGDGGAMAGPMMEMMRSMGPEEMAKMIEHCRQMTAAAPAPETKK